MKDILLTLSVSKRERQSEYQMIIKFLSPSEAFFSPRSSLSAEKDDNVELKVSCFTMEINFMRLMAARFLFLIIKFIWFLGVGGWSGGGPSEEG